MSLTQAKKKYTRRKNDLIRRLDPVPALLQDQSVGKLRLEQTKEGCKVAWDEFKAAYEELADAQSEDETQVVDAEEREQEFGNLEMRCHDLMVSLAETALQREKQAETDRLQLEKTEQIAVKRLHIVNLYGEAKGKLSQLLEQLNLEELPSAEQLVTTENMLVTARCVLKEANKQALEVAGLMPDIAQEMMDTDVAEKTYDKTEHEILVKVNGFKAQYPQLSPVPVSPPATSTSPGDSNKVGAFRFERRSLPKFKGTLREYPTFKKDWISQVSTVYSEEAQLCELRSLVPESQGRHGECHQHRPVLGLHGHRVR